MKRVAIAMMLGIAAMSASAQVNYKVQWLAIRKT